MHFLNVLLCFWRTHRPLPEADLLSACHLLQQVMLEFIISLIQIGFQVLKQGSSVYSLCWFQFRYRALGILGSLGLDAWSSWASQHLFVLSTWRIVSCNLGALLEGVNCQIDLGVCTRRFFSFRRRLSTGQFWKRFVRFQRWFIEKVGRFGTTQGSTCLKSIKKLPRILHTLLGLLRAGQTTGGFWIWSIFENKSKALFISERSKFWPTF